MVPLKAIALPAAAWTVACIVWLTAAAFNVPAGFDGRSMTLSEAAAVASSADAFRLLNAGADPNMPARVRAHLVKNDERMLTPLEAAAGAIRTFPLQMLVDRGATIDSANFAALWCGAMARNNQDMMRFLRPRRVNAALIDCSRVRALW
jgi:hypothetical protein